jgi:hypothetical protein
LVVVPLARLAVAVCRVLTVYAVEFSWGDLKELFGAALHPELINLIENGEDFEIILGNHLNLLLLPNVGLDKKGHKIQKKLELFGLN